MFRQTFISGAVTIVVSVIAVTANAELITTVRISDVSSETVTAVFDRKAEYAIDGSGLEPNGIGTHSTEPKGSMWLSRGTFPEVSGTDPIGAYPNSFIEFDLGDNYDLRSFEVWNYNEINLPNRGVRDVTISVASSVGDTFISLGDFVFNQAPGDDTTDFGQVIDLSLYSAADNVRLIRFDVTSNHGGHHDFVGLSEVQFTAVPEPSILAALLVGALLVSARRRVKSRTTEGVFSH